MKFRDQQVDGFFVVSVVSIVGTDNIASAVITTSVEQKLKDLNADMIDVQYSTRTDSICDGDTMVSHDILVMYCKRK